MKKIRIAQIGTGHAHAAAAFAALKYHSDIFEIVGVAEPVPERVETTLQRKTYEGFPRYTVEELLAIPGLDAVTVETDDLYLTKYAQMAAGRGLHVHMDKPGGIEYRDRPFGGYSLDYLWSLGLLHLATNYYGTQHLSARLWRTHRLACLGDNDYPLCSITQCRVYQDGAKRFEGGCL